MSSRLFDCGWAELEKGLIVNTGRRKTEKMRQLLFFVEGPGYIGLHDTVFEYCTRTNLSIGAHRRAKPAAVIRGRLRV